MSDYRFIFLTDFQRTMSGVIIDSQYTISQIKNQIGQVIKDYVDTEIDKVTSDVIPYKIESLPNANLCGFFSLKVNGGSCVLYQKQLRPAFQGFDAIISLQIANFIQQNQWVGDKI